MKYTLILFLVLGGISVVFIFRSQDTSSFLNNEVDERYSIRAKAFKAKRSLASTFTNQLIPTAKPLRLSSKSEALGLFQLKREKYFSGLDCSQEELAAKLDALNDAHKHLLRFAYQNDIQVEETDYFSPELIIYLSLYLHKKPLDFGITDLKQIEFTQEDWKYVKRFVSSKDFKILLYQNQLSMETSSPQELKELYVTNEDLEKDPILRKISSTEGFDPRSPHGYEIDFPEEDSNKL